MTDKNKNLPKIYTFNEAYESPKATYNYSKNMIEWNYKNYKNNYPKFILNLFNNEGAPIFKSVINKKVKLIAGQGFNKILDPKLQKFVKDNNLELEVKKATYDYQLFNGFAFEIIYDNEGANITSMQHIPLSKIRGGIQTEDIKYNYIWFSPDFSNTRKKGNEPIVIREYNKYIKQGKQIFVYFEYNPDDEYYPTPEYSNSINWIELDYKISVFHLNQAKQGYHPSFILNFADGVPTIEEQDIFFKNFKKEFAGAENASKIIITYSNGSDGKPELMPVQLNDSDERFIMLMEQIDNHIVAGAEIPPQLVILTPGKLGSTQERNELLDEFQKSYVTPRQENIESVLNQILSNVGFTEELKLKQYSQTDVIN